MTRKSDHTPEPAATRAADIFWSGTPQLDVAERLAVLAAVSLGLSDDEVDRACETLFHESQRTELADSVEARVLELLRLAGVDDPEARTALQLRRGLDFFDHVARSGKPAAAFLSRAKKCLAEIGGAAR